MKIEEAIKWMEETIQDAEGLLDKCSPALKEEVLEQNEVFKIAITALRSMQEDGEPIDSPPAHIDRSEWISVKERLPDDKKDGETVLAVVSGKSHENITLCHALMTAGYFPGEGWVVNEYPEWENPTITHWMPLPEPPEEG